MIAELFPCLSKSYKYVGRRLINGPGLGSCLQSKYCIARSPDSGLNMALYDYLFIVIADNRVRNWMFMADPVPLALIIILYLTAVFKIGPSLMLTRKPYDLKPLLAVYNLAMVVTCVTILYLYYKSGVRFSTLLACIDIDYTDDPNSMRILNIMWWTHVIKMVELIETWFFVLRKKESQISFLHVYHHTSTLFLTWVGVKYVGGKR